MFDADYGKALIGAGKTGGRTRRSRAENQRRLHRYFYASSINVNPQPINAL